MYSSRGCTPRGKSFKFFQQHSPIMIEDELEQRDWREYKQLEPVLEEINRLKTIIDKYENSTRSEEPSEVVLDLRAKVQALTEERAGLYKGQSATASKLLDLNELLERTTKERESFKDQVRILEERVKELQGIKGEFENIPTSTIQETKLEITLVIGCFHSERHIKNDGSAHLELAWFGWNGQEYILNNTILPRISDKKACKLFLEDTLAFAALEDGALVVWSRQSARIKHTLNAGSPVLAMKVRGDALVTVQCESIKLWDLRHGLCVRTITARMDEQRAWAAFTDDDTFLVLLGRGKMKVYKSSSGELVKNTQIAKKINHARIRGDWFVVSTGDAVCVYNNKSKCVRNEAVRDVKMVDINTSGAPSYIYEKEGKLLHFHQNATTVLASSDASVLDMHEGSVLLPTNILNFT